MAASHIRVFVGLGLGLMLFVAGGILTADFRPDDAALGPFTVSRGAVFGDRTVAYQNADRMEEARLVMTDVQSAGDRVALWLGASHQYCINGYSPGEENAVYHANRLGHTGKSPLIYVGFGLGNGNFHEFLAAYLHFRFAGLIPDYLVVGAVYDDLREPGIRPRVRELIADVEPALLSRLGAAGEHLLAAQLMAPPPVARTATDGTPQQMVEARIVDWIEKGWAPFSQRHRLSAWISWRWRRSVFDVGEALRQLGSPTRTVPPVPEAMQRWNEAAMEALLKVAADDGVEILVYKVPHPTTTDPFYHQRARYDDFHRRLQARCVAAGMRYVDLENLISLSNWMFDGATVVDHWHFQEPGHILLAEAIDAALRDDG